MVRISVKDGAVWLSSDEPSQGAKESEICIGLSTEPKPKPLPGSKFMEIDTGKTFSTDAGQWTEYVKP